MLDKRSSLIFILRTDPIAKLAVIEWLRANGYTVEPK